MHLHRAPFLIIVSLGLMACADDMADVRSAIGRADAEVADHYAAVASAPSLAEARRELDRHEGIIDGEMRDIRDNLDDSELLCDDGDLGRVWNPIHKVERRIDEYLAEAREIEEIADLVRASSDYRVDMDGLFRDIRHRLDDVDCL